MHIYEYIFAALAVIAILLASNLMLTMTTEPLKVASEREGLKRIAQSIMTQILLNPGDPFDWGSNAAIGENNLRSFGLAYQSRTVREAYVLDADKILRLNSANPFYIPPQKVSELLGLNTREYGFTIEILPQFNIAVEEVQENSGEYKYAVSVRSFDGMNPIQYADVTAKMYYLQGNQIYNSYLINNATGPDGKCTITFGEVPNTVVVVFVVDYRGIRVPKVFVKGSVQWTYLVGQNLMSVSNPSSGMIEEVIAPIRDGKCEIFNVSSEWWIDENNFVYVKYVEPGTIVALAAAGENNLIVAQRFTDLVEYGTVSLRSPSSPLGFMFEKMVSVEDFSYIIRLYVWRLVW